MENKKLILYILLPLLLLCSGSIYAQVNAFIGTWEYQNGNQKFIVSFWEDNEGVTKGHYKLVTVNNFGNETVIYNSKKKIGTSDTDWPYVISLGSNLGGGNITDNTVTNTRGFIQGRILISSLNYNGSTLTLHWKVEKDQGITGPNEPDFNIPTDIILTKVSNTINLD